MVCIYCRGETKTVNSRPSDSAKIVWRRRKCIECQSIFTTYEEPDYSGSFRVKSKNVLSPLSRDKLFISIYSCLSHRKTPQKDASGLTATVLTNILPLAQHGIVTTSAIKGEVLNTLKNFDQVSAVYYKAHYY